MEQADKQMEEARRYTDEGEYEEALRIYDELLENGSDEEYFQSELGDCIQKYIDELIEENMFDEVRELSEKYKDKVSGVDFQMILDEAEKLEQEKPWVDVLYEKMISGNYEDVYAIMEASDFSSNCNKSRCFRSYDGGWYKEYYLLTSSDNMVYAEVSSSTDYLSLSVAHCIHDPNYNGDIHIGDYYYHYYYYYENGLSGRTWLIKNKECMDGVISDVALPDGNLWMTSNT